MDSFFVKLPNRGLVHLEGDDRHKFLQGIITNDIEKLKPGAALYACLLTPQGKFLHDFFISEGDGFTLLECEGGERARDLYDRLGKYRLRADVRISVEENVPIYAVFGGQPQPGYPDPRHADMGWRALSKPSDMNKKPFAEWDRRRIALGVPDGSRDMLVGQSTLDEGNIEKWNGVSYDKGCYVGQELTARMKHRGLGKKHLATVTAKPSLRANENERSNPEYWLAASSDEIMEIRSSCGEVALALVKNT